MNQSYVARYTVCGHSIKQLRNDAKRLRKNDGIRHRDALNRIARELKYSDWDELINQESDPKRDDFIQGMFQDRKDSEITRKLYAEFLRHKHLPDSKDAFRQFVLQHWKSYEALGMKNLVLDEQPMHSDVMLEELTIQVKKHGARGLLPQNMGARLLESTILAGRIINSESEDIPDEIFQGYLATGLLCLTSILSYQQQSPKITLLDNELLDLMGQYYMLAELELMSRRTGLRFTLPDVDHIFQPNAKLGLQFPEGFREIIAC